MGIPQKIPGSQSYIPIYRPKNTHYPFFGNWDPGSQLYQPIYQGFERYPKRFLDPSPLYLSTDQKHTLIFFWNKEYLKMFYPIKSLLLKVTYSSKNIHIYPLYLYTVFDGLHTLIY